MILSFPIGAYLVFNSEIGDDITYEYPMNDLSIFLAGIGFQVPVEFELGDGVIVLWCLFLILFAGHDTTGHTMTFLTYELAKHPEYQKRLHDEVDKFYEMFNIPCK